MPVFLPVKSGWTCTNMCFFPRSDHVFPPKICPHIFWKNREFSDFCRCEGVGGLTSDFLTSVLAIVMVQSLASRGLIEVMGFSSLIFWSERISGMWDAAHVSRVIEKQLGQQEQARYFIKSRLEFEKKNIKWTITLESATNGIKTYAMSLWLGW